MSRPLRISLPPGHSMPPGAPVPNEEMTPFMQAAVGNGYNDDGSSMRVAIALGLINPLPPNTTIADRLNHRDLSDPTNRGGGYGAIHYACQSGNHGALAVLLEAGADPNLVKNNGCTGLHTAIASCASPNVTIGTGVASYLRCVELLCDHPSFDRTLSDREELSPVCMCVSRDHTISDGRDVTLPLLKAILARGFDANGTSRGVSALHMALQNGHLECALTIARAGANVAVVDPMTGRQAIQAAEESYGKGFAFRLLEAASSAATPNCQREPPRRLRIL